MLRWLKGWLEDKPKPHRFIRVIEVEKGCYGIFDSHKGMVPFLSSDKEIMCNRAKAFSVEGTYIKNGNCKVVAEYLYEADK